MELMQPSAHLDGGQPLGNHSDSSAPPWSSSAGPVEMAPVVRTMCRSRPYRSLGLGRRGTVCVDEAGEAGLGKVVCARNTFWQGDLDAFVPMRALLYA